MDNIINDEQLEQASGGVIINGVEYYRVKAGDTLSEIAERFGVTTKALAEANGITNPDLIRANTTIVIPNRK